MTEIRQIPFDGNVKVGEIRIFADFPQPFLALVTEDRGLSGWRIVPVSPLSTAMSVRERVVGPRVFQLWNTCTASRRIVSRSWIVDSVSADALASLVAAIPAASPGRVTAGDGPVARYERENLISGGNFAFLPGAVPPCAGTVPDGLPRAGSVFGKVFLSRYFRIAASFAACVGFFYALMGPGRENLRAWKESFAIVRIPQEDAAVELLDMPEEREMADDEDVNIDFFDKSSLSLGPVPKQTMLPTACQEGTVPIGLDQAIAYAREIPPGTVPLTTGNGEFIDPAEKPLVVLECLVPTRDAVNASVGGDSRRRGERPQKEHSKTAALEKECADSMIDCMVAPCPWNSHANLLAVRVKNAASVRVELVFLKESVGGFRGVKVDSREVIVFEVLPRPGKSLAGDFCHVTARGLAMDDSRLRRVSMRRVESLVSEGIPVSDSARRSAPEAADTKGDIPVDVVF